MDVGDEGTAEAKRRADFISAPRLPAETCLEGVAGNCGVFH